MSGKDFIPGPDGELDDFLKQFQTAVGGAPADFGLAATDGTLIQTKYAAWSTAYGAHLDAQKAAHTAATVKDAARADAETTARGLTTPTPRPTPGRPSITSSAGSTRSWIPDPGATWSR